MKKEKSPGPELSKSDGKFLHSRIQKEFSSILGGNWGKVNPVNNNGGDGGGGEPAGPAADLIDGFPDRCPSFAVHPEFLWNGRNNGTAKSRRVAFERSISRIPLSTSRDPHLPRDRNIDPQLYRRIQDMENRITCK